MSIFIFEDDILQAEQLKKDIVKICDIHDIFYDFIEVTSRSERLIEHISKTTQIPIYFLDIEIKSEKKKGLTVAQQIRQIDPHGMIVFITTHAKFAPISYQYMVSALTFIDKGLDYERRYEMIENCLIHYKMRNHNEVIHDDFIVDNEYATVRVPFNDIYYIKTSSPHRLILMTDHRMIQFYGRLKEIESSDKRFFRCHRSYLINKNKIESFDKEKKVIVLTNGEKIPVSRRLIRHVRQLLKGEL